MELYSWLLYSVGYLFVGVFYLWIAKKVFDFLTPYSVNVHLTEKDNPAIGILLSGYLLGVLAVLCSLYYGETSQPTIETFQNEMIEIAIFGSIGFAVLFIAGIINDKLILNQFCNRKEIVEKHNKAVAMIMAASYIGSGLVVAGSLRGSPDIQTALGVFAIGQVAVVIFALIYQLVTKYDDQKEIGENQNVPAAMAFSGNIIAFSMILMQGASISPEEALMWTWTDRLYQLGYYAGAGVVLLVIARFVADHIFLPKVNISDEIVKDRNLNAGLIEFALVFAVGAILLFSL